MFATRTGRSFQRALVLTLLPAAAIAAPVNYEMNLHTASGMGSGGGVAAGLGMLFGGGKSSSVMRNMDLRLVNPADLPADYSAAHTVPEAMKIGPALPLKGERRSGGRDGDDSREREPEGRVLIYWGCSPTVPKGQPEIIDFKALAGSVSPEIAAMARQGMQRGAKGSAAGESLPPRAIGWPWHDRDYKGIPDDASAVGDHVVKANFMKDDIRFALGKDLDFLAPINLKTSAGNTRAAIPLTWDAQARVRGYDLTAVGAGSEKEVVMWMAAKGKSPMLPGSQHECTIPEGIFAKAQMAMVNAVAHGPTQGFAYPPQKPGEKKPLIWSARVRVNAMDNIAVGLGEAAGGAAEESAAPAGLGGLLRGVLGR